MNQSDRERGRERGHQRKLQTVMIRATKAKEMLDEGIAIGKIAKHFGVSRQTINNDLKRISE